MGKKITIKDIAAEAGVSTALVSFALSNQEGRSKRWNVNIETEQRILEIVKKHNFKPNSSARSLRTNSTRTIGVILSDISNSFFSGIARQIEDCAFKLGYTIIFGSSDENAARFSNLVTILMSKGVDGLIAVPCVGCEDSIERIIEADIPLVLIDREAKPHQISSVLLDNAAAVEDMAGYLYDKGCRNICMISYDMRLSNIIEREDAFVEQMKKYGIGHNSFIRRMSYGDIASGMVDFFDSDHFAKVDAIMFATNSLAYEGVYRLVKAGVNVPEDLTVVTFDHNTAFDLYGGFVPYVRQPIEEFASESIRLLLKQIEAKENDVEKVILKQQFIVD